MKKILIATGGTGGHIYPALVTAQVLKDRGWDVLFIGKFGPAAEKIDAAGFSFVDIQVQGFVSRGPVQAVLALMCLVKSFFSCAFTILRYRPSVVLGFGGYSSFPTVMAGVILGKRTIIHEQNAHPGLANRVLARFVRRVALTFRDADAFFPEHKTCWTGCPLRPLSQPRPRQEILDSMGFEEGKKIVLVFGGSQGARALNETFLQVLQDLGSDTPWQVIHLTGGSSFEKVKPLYATIPVTSFVRAYADNMADLYAVCDVVVARSGAGTVTELGLLGIPAVLIPYPHAQNHQIANARVLARHGVGVIIEEKDLNPGILRDKIFSLLQENLSREENRRKTGDDFAADAALRLADAVRHLGND